MNFPETIHTKLIEYIAVKIRVTKAYPTSRGGSLQNKLNNKLSDAHYNPCLKYLSKQK